MGSLAKGSLRKVCRNSAEILQKIRFIASGKGAEQNFGKPQTGSFVTGSFPQALATRSSSARQTSVSIVFVFAIARQTLAKSLSKTTRLESTRLGLPENYYIPFFLFGGIIFGNCYRKLYSIIFLGELITVM